MARDYDVIIVGGGGAGLAAAVAARDGGARALVVESQEELGGSTALSTGIFLAAGTSAQRAAGVDDDPDAMYAYHMAVNQWRRNPAITRAFCDNAAPTLEWLLGLGPGLDVEVRYTGMDALPRGHQPEGGGTSIIRTLHWACRDRGVDVALGSRVEQLHATDGHVTGVRAGGEDVSSAAVVVATGGFGQNTEKLREHYPDAVYGDRTWSISAPGALGDAFTFAEQVGAAIDGHNRGLTVPALRAHTDEFSGQFLTVFRWFVYLDGQGRRFIDEAAYLSVQAEAIRAHGGTCWAVLDEASRLRVGPQLAFGELFTGQPLAEDAAARWDETRVVRASTLEELAARTEMIPELLTRTLDRYNAGCARGEDSAFRKDPRMMRPVETPPFYAVQVAPFVVALTGCGLRIDADARVLDELDGPIEGLYAAGEATGSWIGEIYVASGNSIANSIVFGRIAGTNAAAYAALQEA